jgi:peptidoglycan hydrolase-like protein with peptidoglycan-binding domain
LTQLIEGSVGPEVKNLQRALNYHLPELTPPLVADGIFGPKTHARVVRFQDLYDIPPPRGLVGPRTQRALYTFVRLRHHLLFVTYGPAILGARTMRRVSSFQTVGDELPQPLPPIPRMPFPYPEDPTRLPSLLPQLQLDPQTLAALRSIKLEVEAGKQTSFKTTLGQGSQPREVQLFADAKATVWSKPLGSNAEISAGPGIMVEKRMRSADGAEVSVYVWVKTEVEAGKVGPLTIAKLQAEGQIAGASEGPPEMSATVTAGPEVEVEIAGRKVTLGPGIYAGIKKDKDGYQVEGGAKVSATVYF